MADLARLSEYSISGLARVDRRFRVLVGPFPGRGRVAGPA